MIITRQYIHNARNRLMGLALYLENNGQKVQSDEVVRIGTLLSAAMALLKLEDKSEPLSVQEVDLNLFFSDLSSQILALSPTHIQAQCTADFSNCLFPIWTFDDELVRMVIIDALMNAWRYAELTVIFNIVWRNGELIFTVTDDGPGYPEEILSTQGEHPLSEEQSTTQYSGTGNGLYLAREIAEKHRSNGKSGHIYLANEPLPKHGAIFELRLP